MNILTATLIFATIALLFVMLTVATSQGSQRANITFLPNAPLKNLNSVYGRVGTFNFVGNWNSPLLVNEPVIIKSDNENQFGSVYMSPATLPFLSYDPETDLLTVQLLKLGTSAPGDPEVSNLGAFFFESADEMRDAIGTSIILTNGLPTPTRKADIPAQTFNSVTAQYTIPNFGKFFSALGISAKALHGVVFLYSTY